MLNRMASDPWMSIRPTWLDVAVGFWVVLAGAAFVVPMVFGVGQPEPEQVGRYVYLIVIAGCIVALAFRALRMVRR